MVLVKSFLNLLSSDPSQENRKYMKGKESDEKTEIELKKIEAELDNIYKRKKERMLI